MKKNIYIHIQWTAPTIDEARTISRALVEQRKVACANLLPNVESIFIWKNQVDTAQEVKVFFKTKDEKYEAVRDYILEHGSYEVPEISKIHIEEGNPDYLKWIDSMIGEA